MKTSTLLAIFAILIGGCAAHCPMAGARPSPVEVSSSPDLLVISAVYGSGVKFADVTARADQLLHQPGTEFFARPEWLHADPTPGWNKALVIVYDVNGRRHIFTTGEGGRVSSQLLLERAKQKPKRKHRH